MADKKIPEPTCAEKIAEGGRQGEAWGGLAGTAIGGAVGVVPVVGQVAGGVVGLLGGAATVMANVPRAADDVEEAILFFTGTVGAVAAAGVGTAAGVILPPAVLGGAGGYGGSKAGKFIGEKWASLSCTNAELGALEKPVANQAVQTPKAELGKSNS